MVLWLNWAGNSACILPITYFLLVKREGFLHSAGECSDKELIRRIRLGEDEAFTLLVLRFHRPIYAIVYRMVGNAAEAEDVCQEIFLRIYQNLSSYDSNMPLAPWLYRVACNHTLNHLKRRAANTVPLKIMVGGKEYERPLLDTKQNPEQTLIVRRQGKQLQQALLKLPENYRLVFTLKYLEDLTAEQISEIIQVPRNTVKTWLFRAREILRSELKDEL